MRNGILKFLIATMLFVSMEGVAESVDDASFHQTHHAHTDDSGSQWFPDSDGNDHEGDACEHFCHAHAVALTAQITLPNVSMSRSFVSTLPAHTVTSGTAPPIPPPNL